MSTTAQLPFYLQQSTRRRFTVAEFHRMLAVGVFPRETAGELLDGYLLNKPQRSDRQDATVKRLNSLFTGLPFAGFVMKCGEPITLSRSEPEPAFMIGRGSANNAIVVEVSESSLLIDRHDKGRIYAEAGIPVYWVVNVEDRVIEVYTQPAGTGSTAAYAKCDVFAVGASVPVVIDGNPIGNIAVADVMG